MVAIYHLIPVAHIGATVVQFYVYSLQNKGFNQNLCIIAGSVTHEITEIILNIAFSRVDRILYNASDPNKTDEGFFGDLTLNKFLAKATSSFTLTKIVDSLLPSETICNSLVSSGVAKYSNPFCQADTLAKSLHMVISGLAGIIGTEIPDWLEGTYQPNV